MMQQQQVTTDSLRVATETAARLPSAILVLGSSGQVGSALVKELQQRRWPYTGLHRADANLADLRQVRHLVNEWVLQQRQMHYGPHPPYLVVLNAVAYTQVDQAEAEPALARLLNAELPAQLHDLSRELGFRLVHYSSDYVYDGQGEQPWQETDRAQPLSVYGHTKLAGDQAVLAQPQALVLRTSWVYSRTGRNFLTTMLRLGRQQKALQVVDDQVGAPTPAALLAVVTLALVQRQQVGLYHVVPRGETSWAGFAHAIFQQVGWPVQVVPIASEDYPTAARRPLNSRLSVQHLENRLQHTLPQWDTLLKEQLS